MTMLNKLQSKWRIARDRCQAHKDRLNAKYGNWRHGPAGQRQRVETAQVAEDRAQDAIFVWLDENSPRYWRSGVPCYWICESLTLADALTAGPLSVVPPLCYGAHHGDAVRFAAALPQVA